MSNKWITLAKSIWPGIDSSEADTLLWACTMYPEGNEAEITAALRAAYSKSGGDVWIALNQADEERTRQLRT